MIGRIRFLNIRNFARQCISRVEEVPKRSARMIFCSGDEEIFEIEKRNEQNKRAVESEISVSNISQKTEPSKTRFVCGDDDIKDIKASSAKPHRLQLRPIKKP